MTAGGAPSTTCPTPDKRQYRSQAEANRDQRERHSRHRGHQQRHYPYECPSGEHWHLTHHTPERQKAVFEDGHVGLSAMANSFEGQDVRHVFTDQPLWIGRDVCEAVGISKHRDALAQLDADERASVVVDTLGGPQRMTAVTEAGIWSLMLISRSEKVQPFKRWLTHEVLPTIRKQGRYDPSVALPDRKTMAQWVIDAETRAEAAESRVRELAPAASSWNELAEATGDYSVADAGKVLSRDPNINIKERALFAYMAGLEWVFKRDGRWKAMRAQLDTGRLAEKVARPYWHEGRGEMVAGEPTVRITPKGLQELHRRLGGGEQLALIAGVS